MCCDVVSFFKHQARAIVFSIVAIVFSQMAGAINFVETAPPKSSWGSIQTPNSVGCEMLSSSGNEIYVGQCQDSVPHGRGLLITRNKGIEGAKMDKGSAYSLSSPELLQNTRQYDDRANYLYAYYRILWTSDGFDTLPGPQGSAVIGVANQFISQYSGNDGDGLVPKAKSAARGAMERAHAKAWAYVESVASSSDVARYVSLWRGLVSPENLSKAEMIGAQRFRAEYDQAFRSVHDIYSANAFIGSYSANDPDRRLPRVKEMLASYELEKRRREEERARQEAARRAREDANPQCMAQKRTCMAQCAAYGNWGDSPRNRCEFECGRIRCD